MQLDFFSRYQIVATIPLVHMTTLEHQRITKTQLRSTSLLSTSSPLWNDMFKTMYIYWSILNKNSNEKGHQEYQIFSSNSKNSVKNNSNTEG
jgi:aspartate/glutamate racemase